MANMITGIFVVVVASLLSTVVSQAAGEIGLIGYGISEYHPICCWTCQDVLFDPYLSCTTFMEMDMKLRAREMTMMGSTSNECRLSNKPYMQTLAYCIKNECDKRGVSYHDQQTCFHQVLPTGSYNMTYDDTIPRTAPAEMLSEDAQWLNTTMLVNGPHYLVSYATLKGYSRIGYAHSRYSLFLWFFTVGVCCVVGLHRLTKKYIKDVSLAPLSPSNAIRKHVLVPALFGQRHLEPLPYKIGYVPSRSLSIFIFTYVSLNIIFSSADIHLVWPATWWASKRIETANNVGDRTGVLSLANMALTILFSGRNTLIIAITGWSQNTTLTFHRWAARVATVQAIVHSIVYSVQFYWMGGAKEYYADMAFPGYYWGAIGTVALAIILPFAVLPLRARFYEIFLILHIILVIVALLGTWYHIYLTYGAQNYYGFQIWLFIAFALWGFDRLVRLVRLAILNRHGRSEAAFELLPGGSFVQVTVFPKTKWRVKPGQHMFLYMARLGKVWENHPFTIANHGHMASGPQNTNGSTELTTKSISIQNTSPVRPESDLEKAMLSNARISTTQAGSESSSQLEDLNSTPRNAAMNDKFYIRFICRMHAGMTASLRKRVTAFTTDGMTTMPGKVLLEGPYGSHRQAYRPLEMADTVLCVTGGIGITHNLGYLQRYADDAPLPAQQRDPCMRYTQRLVFAWTARETELMQHVRGNLMPLASALPRDNTRRLEYQFWITGMGDDGRHVEHDGTVLETGHRMNVAEVVSQVIAPTKRVVVIVCGPGGLADAVRAEVVQNIGKCKSLDLVEEAFGW